MIRVCVLAALCFCVLGCWMFERTDDRPAPIVEAGTDALEAFQANKDALIIPGVPDFITALIGGGSAAAFVFVRTLIRRKKELDAAADAVVDAVTPDPPPAPVEEKGGT